MENKTLTAVEWLIEEVFGEHTSQWDKEIQKALSLEREQTENAYNDGREEQYQYHINSEPRNYEEIQSAELYYTTKYGKQ